MHLFNKLLKGLNRIEKYVNISAAIVLVIATFSQVVFRFVLNSPLSWTEELARLCFVWLSVFGASMALRQGRHISFDYLTNKFLIGKFNRFRIIAVNLILLAFLIYIFVPGLRYVEIMNTVPLAGTSWPTGILFISFPLASVIMVINLIHDITREVLLLFNRKESAL